MREKLINICLPYPPTVNTYYRTVNNRVILSKKGREYKEQVEFEYFQLYSKLSCSKKPQFNRDDKLKVHVNVFAPDRRKRDIMNLQKALFDAMEGFYFEDDNQIDDCRFVRCDVDKKRPRVEVTITKIKDGNESV